MANFKPSVAPQSPRPSDCKKRGAGTKRERVTPNANAALLATGIKAKRKTANQTGSSLRCVPFARQFPLSPSLLYPHSVSTQKGQNVEEQSHSVVAKKSARTCRFGRKHLASSCCHVACPLYRAVPHIAHCPVQCVVERRSHTCIERERERDAVWSVCNYKHGLRLTSTKDLGHKLQQLWVSRTQLCKIAPNIIAPTAFLSVYANCSTNL